MNDSYRPGMSADELSKAIDQRNRELFGTLNMEEYEKQTEGK